MTAKEAIAYIEAFTWSTTRLGLERTRTLLRALGDPQKKLKFVHVTGSNGKGSTCSMLASVLQEAGYKTGLYISPYIEQFEERIQINGRNISGEALAAITERVRAVADAMEDHPSQFELVTAIGFVYFLEQNCDIVVLEVGMGGALDSTNAIDAPEVAVITNIGLEHTEYLGDTLEKIAETKAGIIKPGCEAVLYQGFPEVTKTVQDNCSKKQVPLTLVDFEALKPLNENLDGQDFLWKNRPYHIGLLGSHQLNNAATALTVLEALRKKGWRISEEEIRGGLRKASWPARLEVMRREPLFLLDGGHNPQCTEALAQSLPDLLPKGEKAVFVLGILADKDYRLMVKMLLPYAKHFVCVTPVSPRALKAGALKQVVTECGAKASAARSVESGLRTAFRLAGRRGSIVAFGSLYLAGAVRTILRTEKQ